jgi:hypothetical protein
MLGTLLCYIIVALNLVPHLTRCYYLMFLSGSLHEDYLKASFSYLIVQESIT